MAREETYKIVLDPVHGIIHLDALAVKIIDTLYFQRLRYLKQLAFADFVYPGATHTRFAHSIGVYHLACQMINAIEAHKLPDGAIEMSPEDKKCIRVAALCHDLGHGPFSHVYTQIGNKVLKEDDGSELQLKHEDVTLALVDKMFKDDRYHLKKDLGPDGKAEELLNLIKELIRGKCEAEMLPTEKRKKYMFQIVSNVDSGVDVDKWDYFNRDAMACGISERFQYERALSVARVVKTRDGVFELGYRDYDAFNLYSMFNTRFTLYRKIYKHKVVVAMDLMMRDVFRSVLRGNKIKNDKRERIDLFPLRQKDDLKDQDKLNKFLKMTDDLLFKIRDSSEELYRDAQDLIQRIHDRQLYKLVMDIPVVKVEDLERKVAEIRVHIENTVKKLELKIPEDIEIEELRFDYGQMSKDPIMKLYFYRKGQEDTGVKLDKDSVSPVLPRIFQEVHLRLYQKLKSTDEEKLAKLDELKKMLPEKAISSSSLKKL
ncbi:hypothetical protein CHS0354_018982 [Potamilus streckersoni]|uniref:HD/PDEase domain-containing protein n=1 Tax=Potamilus streckersoni TaxID=2493646 RepID=A0AAE0SLL1_9BIVA|nr:hypothetical protein CHS0354_018982 [Potamilus streckersoni]